MWLDEDVEVALAWQAEQRCICPGGCGLPIDETTRPDAIYIAEPVTCRACRAREQMRKSMRDDGGDGAGMQWIHREVIDTDDD